MMQGNTYKNSQQPPLNISSINLVLIYLKFHYQWYFNEKPTLKQQVKMVGVKEVQILGQMDTLSLQRTDFKSSYKCRCRHLGHIFCVIFGGLVK